MMDGIIFVNDYNFIHVVIVKCVHMLHLFKIFLYDFAVRSHKTSVFDAAGLV